MPLRYWKCPECEEVYRSFKEAPSHCEIASEQLLSAPKTKFQETDEWTGKSKVVGEEKVLKARARNHSRDHDLDDLIAKNDRHTAKQNHWITESGQKRRAIDDL